VPDCQYFAEQLLRDQKRVLGRFDTRDVEGPAAASGRASTVNRYLRTTLGFTITAMCYDGGHMMYDEPDVRRQVTKDVAAFYKRAAGGR
jgi:carboxypeptidase C (cathepsin A)